MRCPLLSCITGGAMSHTLGELLIGDINLRRFAIFSENEIMKFLLTVECRSQKEVKVFLVVFPFGYYFGFPLRPVLI